MKKTMLAGVAALAVCGATTTALAADLPPRAPRVFAPAPAIAPSFSWTGFYIGAHAGWGTARKKWSQTSPVEFASGPQNTATFDADGVIGGGQIGYNWQAGMWVFGLEADFTGSDLDGSAGQTRTTNWRSFTDINWFGTATGRIGVVWDRALLYAKGGFAWADETHRIFFSGGAAGGVPTLVSTTDNVHTGWTVGAGVEVALWDNWTGKVEYNYFDLGTDNLHFVIVPPAMGSRLASGDNWDINQRFHMVKFGLNYRWGGLRF